MKSVLFSPHSDDAVLFAAYTLIREKPLVVTVTDSFIQSNRGENITADQRWAEDLEAMKLLDRSLFFGNIRDDIIDEWAVKNLLNRFYNFSIVYAPAVQGGNKDHDLIGRLAKERFGDRCIQYTTYTPTELYTMGSHIIDPDLPEIALKEKAVACYKSQINLPATAPHFAAVKGKPEWYI